MKNLFIVLMAIGMTATASAKVSTSIPGEAAVRFALDSEKVAEAVESIGQARLVEIQLEETLNTGDIKQYRHTVMMRYVRYTMSAPCWVNVELGLQVKKDKKTGITYSQPKLMSVKPICAQH